MTDIDVDPRPAGGEDDAERGGSVEDTQYVPRTSRPERHDEQRRDERGPDKGGPVDGFKVTGPRAAGPRAAGPRAAGPRAAGPGAAGPRPAAPKATGPRVTGPQGPSDPAPRPPGPPRLPRPELPEERTVHLPRLPHSPGRVPTPPPPPERPFFNAFTDTIDLTALRNRLRMEDTEILNRVEAATPRLYKRPGRTDENDPESTQILPRDSRALRQVRRPMDPGVPPGRGRRGYADEVLDEVVPVGDRASDAEAGDPADRDEAEDTAGRHRVGGGGGSAKSKAIWTLSDQAISSVTNAAISFLIAHQVTSTEYGAFGIAYTVFALVVGLSRSSACLPLSMFYSGSGRSEFRSAAAATAGTALAFGTVVGVAMIATGAAIGGVVGPSMMAMGFVLPGLLLQDAWRYVFFAQGKPVGAFANDLAWALVQVIGVYLLIHRGVTDAPPLIMAWGVSALIAALLGVAQSGFWPSPSQTRAWLTKHKDNAWYLAAEYIVTQGALQTSMLVIGVVGSLSTVGALQGVRTLLGPTTVVGVGIVSFAVPEFSRRKNMSAKARERAAAGLSAAVLVIGAIWGLIFLLLPYRYSVGWMGDSGPGVHHILGLSVLHYLAAALPVGPACMIYALGKAKLTFRINMAFAPMLFGFPILGLLIGDATGAVIGYNIAFWAIAPVWFILLRRLARQHDAEQAEAEAGDGDGSGGAAAVGSPVAVNDAVGPTETVGARAGPGPEDPLDVAPGPRGPVRPGPRTRGEPPIEDDGGLPASRPEPGVRPAPSRPGRRSV